MKFTPALIALALLFTGCSKSQDSAEAVKQGIIRDLSSKVDVKNMDVNVSSVSFRGSLADATVVFSAKGQPGAGMSMKYTLEKKDDGWHILRRQGDAAAHGGAAGMTGGMPGGMPGQRPGEGDSNAMPPNHPPINGVPPAKSLEKQ